MVVADLVVADLATVSRNRRGIAHQTSRDTGNIPMTPATADDDRRPAAIAQRWQHRPAQLIAEKEVSRHRPRPKDPGRCRYNEARIAIVRSGTGIEREPDAECLLPRRAFGPAQLLGNFARWRLLARHRFQITELACSPRAPLFWSLGHKTSLSTKSVCIPYGSG